MFRAKRLLGRSSPLRGRRFCDKTTKPTTDGSSEGGDKARRKYDEAYRQLDNLDFATASRILFSDPPKKKKFGFDFHLVQFFFACMPSLAVYLVAQYARSEMRRMDAELEQRMKEEEEEKAREMERKAIEDRERYLPEISDVQSRLDKLEVAVKEIAVQSIKQQSGNVGKDQEDDHEKKGVVPEGHDDTSSRSESTKSRERDDRSQEKSVNEAPSSNQEKLTGPAPILDTSLPEQKGNKHNGRPPNDANR